jgi:hypothetical protein
MQCAVLTTAFSLVVAASMVVGSGQPVPRIPSIIHAFLCEFRTCDTPPHTGEYAETVAAIATQINTEMTIDGASIYSSRHPDSTLLASFGTNDAAGITSLGDVLQVFGEPCWLDFNVYFQNVTLIYADISAAMHWKDDPDWMKHRLTAITPVGSINVHPGVDCGSFELWRSKGQEAVRWQGFIPLSVYYERTRP